MQNEWWQLCEYGKAVRIYQYFESGDALQYNGCVFSLDGKCKSEVLLIAAMRGITVFRAAPPKFSTTEIMKCDTIEVTNENEDLEN